MTAGKEKKFFVGTGKAVRRKAPQAHEQVPPVSLPASAAPRRFLVGDGTRQPVAQPVTRDPVTRYGVPVRANGCTCVQPERTGHVPFCKYFADALYVCEQADRRSFEMLARSAGSTLGDLQWRRKKFAEPDPACPDICNTVEGDPRRRCWLCPFWNRHGGTPIQLAYEDRRGSGAAPGLQVDIPLSEQEG